MNQAAPDLFGQSRVPRASGLAVPGQLATFHALRPVGGFDLIMADPPWSYEMYSDEG